MGYTRENRIRDERFEKDACIDFMVFKMRIIQQNKRAEHERKQKKSRSAERLGAGGCIEFLVLKKLLLIQGNLRVFEKELKAKKNKFREESRRGSLL